MKEYMVLLSDEGAVVGIIVVPNPSGQSFKQNVEEYEARIKNLVADAIEQGGWGEFDDLQNEIELTIDSGNYLIKIDAGKNREYSLTSSSLYESPGDIAALLVRYSGNNPDICR